MTLAWAPRGVNNEGRKRLHSEVEPNVSFPKLEEETLAWWTQAGIVRKALTFREGSPEFVFYEGPPYANAPPGVHSVLPRVIKDVYTRFQTMKGRFVPRKAGWDCHGLPAEVEVEKKLGIKHKREILDYGIDRFNHLCRTAVSEYIDNYVRFSNRIAFWLDYDDAYKTMDNDYIESVWWSLAEFHKRGRLFEADRVAPYCPRCETPLSDHELGQEDVYREVTDPGITMALPLEGEPVVNGVPLAGAALAAWTTQPWTLLPNMAAVVNPAVTYALVEEPRGRFLVAEGLVQTVFGEGARTLATFAGSELAGLRYRPPFDYAARALAGNADAQQHAWRVLAEDFVAADEGTGIVQISPAFGAEDLEASRSAGIPVFKPVDAQGRFDHRVPEFKDMYVKEADAGVIESLRQRGLLLRSEPYAHSYPHCWRCEHPLLYYALVSWYIRTTEYKDRMLACNADVNWIPAHIRDGRFGNWLANNVDWSLSRFRFWGTPLPIWRCEQAHDLAVESVAQLSELAGRDLSTLDLHRPHVDEVTFACPQCGKESRRVPDVIDVWYDAGAMPFAQHGYPRRNAQLFQRSFPAHFIAEALDQTRGWFYSLMAESVGLFDENAYKTVICHGLILDDEGKKMSKHKAIADPWRVFDTYGSDVLRFYFLSAGDPADSRRLSEDALRQVVRGPFLTLWNVYRLYVMYANVDGFDPNRWQPISPNLRPAIDRWILAELQALISEVDDALSSYDSLRASRAIALFIDDMSNWYVRRTRRRFWRTAESDDERADKSAAYWTLWTCLSDLAKVLAPFAPFLAEAMYRNLVGAVNPNAPESVHLTDFPEADPHVFDAALQSGMAAVRELASLGHSARRSAGVKVRQPLSRAVLLVPLELVDAVGDVADVLADELNVDEVEFAEEASALVKITLKPNFPVAGPEFGPKVGALARGLSSLGAEAAAELAARLEMGEDADVEVGEGDVLRVGAEHVDIRREPAEGTAFAYDAPFGVSLDLEITPDLRREGLAREFVHQAQSLRRELGLEVTDRIEIAVAGPDDVLSALREYADYVSEELLATSLRIGEDVAPEAAKTLAVDGTEVAVAANKA
jgi:isoleucyl-tRNA synthetase